MTLLAVCGMTQGDRYVDLAITSIGGGMLALVVVIGRGSIFGAF